jgi:hypothetical protein
MSNDYLLIVTDQFRAYKTLGDKTFSQMRDEDLFRQFHEDSNSVAMIVKHLSGNMFSRWTDFLTTDGEKEWRDRDSEFLNDLRSREEVLERWDAGWNCLFNALQQLSKEDLDRVVEIRQQGHTVMEAINRQLAHYAYHVGQLVFIGKMLAEDRWQTLSIPKRDAGRDTGKDFSPLR